MENEPILDVAHLGHLELLTPKPEESLQFFVHVMGMTESGRQGDSVYLHAYDDYERHSLKLTASKLSGLGHVALSRTKSASTRTAGSGPQSVGLRYRLDEWRPGAWPGVSLPGPGRTQI